MKDERLTVASNSKLLVYLCVRSRGTESVDAKLLVAVFLPSSGRQSLERKNRCSTSEDGEPVFFRLLVESEPAWQTDDSGLDSGSLQFTCSLDSDGDLATSRDNGELFTLLLVKHVSTLERLLNGRALELRKVLSGK